MNKKDIAIVGIKGKMLVSYEQFNNNVFTGMNTTAELVSSTSRTPLLLLLQCFGEDDLNFLKP